jgi:adenylate cyclase
MTERKNVCILLAEVTGGERLVDRIGTDEARHAVDRCLNRVERVIESHGGEHTHRDGDCIVTVFERCDGAVLAACEMLERVMALPPMSGVQLATRIGVHYGALDQDDPPRGEGVVAARMLAFAAEPGQALASAAAVMLLSTSARHFAGGGKGERNVPGLDWAVYELSHKAGLTTALPAANHASHQLKVRHQKSERILDEQQPTLLMGREHSNDVVIIDQRASRNHARIERRSAGFFLVDQSTNGTFVVQGDHVERCVKQGELLLTEAGRIGCGFSVNETVSDLVFFEFI